jgi:hypothetical protein
MTKSVLLFISCIFLSMSDTTTPIGSINILRVYGKITLDIQLISAKQNFLTIRGKINISRSYSNGEQ